MRLRVLPLLLGVTLLTGCASAREVPAPITDTELQAYLEDRLDAAWLNTGLDGFAQRPESDRSTLAERYRDGNNMQAFNDCLGQQGITSWGADERNGGPVFLTGSGSTAEPSLQLDWYRCFAEHPTDATFSGVRFSQAESEYLYDYYQEWVIPCLELQGYSVMFVPTREEYITGVGFEWIPYYNLGPGLSGEDPYANSLEPGFFIELADRCGDPFPGMPYGERYGF